MMVKAGEGKQTKSWGKYWLLLAEGAGQPLLLDEIPIGKALKIVVKV